MKSLFLNLGLLSSVLVTTVACQKTPDLETASAVKGDSVQLVQSLADLKTKSNAELAAMFAQGLATPIPSQDNPGVAADGEGLPIIMAGGLAVNSFANQFWQGKVFTTDQSGQTTLINKLGMVDGISAVVTRLPEGLQKDGKPSILLDYSKSDVVLARQIRDEIRLVAPGLYLGMANIENPEISWRIFGLKRYTFVCWFALQFPST